MYVVREHPQLGSSDVALIMIFTEVAGLICSPIIGNVLERFGRKNIIVCGFMTMVFGSGSLALTDLLKNDMAYLIVAVVCRFV